MKNLATFHCLILLGGLLLPMSAASQSTDVSASPQETLKHLAATNSLKREGISPWHLQMSFNLFDLNGKQKEQGKIEMWYVSATNRRVVITSPSYNSSIPGPSVAQDGYSRENFLVHRLLDQVIEPVPDFVDFFKLSVLQTEDHLKNLSLKCFKVLPQYSQNQSRGVHPEFCFDMDSQILRVSYGEANSSAVRNSLARSLKTTFGRDIALSYEGRPAISGHVDLLESYDPDQTKVELSEVPDTTSEVPGIIYNRAVLSKKQPVYPDDARANHISGTVLLSISVAPDGVIKKLDVVSSPDSSLSQSALQAVRFWTYKPYVDKGSPVTVNSTVTVNYSLNQK